jgi:nicotine blue oxidoreductase
MIPARRIRSMCWTRRDGRTGTGRHPEVRGVVLDQGGAEQLGRQIFGPLLREAQAGQRRGRTVAVSDRPGLRPRQGLGRTRPGYGGGMAQSVAGLLLAAGGGRRLGGRAKALLPYREGLLVDAAAGALHRAGCVPVHVVLGAAAEEVRRRARLDGCTVVENPAWESGMGSSLRAGLASLPPGTAAVLVSLVDQPGVGAAALRRVREAHRGPRTLAAAAYGGRRGHPVLLGADHLPEVIRLAQGDEGARRYLREREAQITLVECADVASPEDVDLPDDLRLLQERQ